MTHCPKSFHAPCAGALARPTTQGEVQTKYLGRPVSRSGDAFAYNARGEVTNVVVVAFRYDNNGNVIGYWDESGSIVAEYAYDAFGNTIASSGSMASVFPHRFSTKYYDAETDLYYYGYRYYSRWVT